MTLYVLSFQFCFAGHACTSCFLYAHILLYYFCSFSHATRSAIARGMQREFCSLVLLVLLLVAVAVPMDWSTPPKPLSTAPPRLGSLSTVKVQGQARQHDAPAATVAATERSTAIPAIQPESVRTSQPIAVVHFPPAPSSLAPACSPRLYTPTYVGKHFGVWFIVDCWHHRVLFHELLDAPIHAWRELGGGRGSPAQRPLRIPHSVADNGFVLVTESSVGGSDGFNHSVVVYRPVFAKSTSIGADGRRGPDIAVDFTFVQELTACLPDDGSQIRRPHRVGYDVAAEAFFLYLTKPPALVRFEYDAAAKRLRRAYCTRLGFMGGVYARSFALVNDSLFLTAGPGAITQVALTQSVPEEIKPLRGFGVKPLGFGKGGMNDLQYIDGWWYATSTRPCAIVRFRSLHNMKRHEKLTGKLGMCGVIPRTADRCHSGTPYFVSAFEGRIFVPYIFGCSGVVSFVAFANGTIGDVRQHWGSGWVETKANMQCRGKEW